MDRLLDYCRAGASRFTVELIRWSLVSPLQTAPKPELILHKDMLQLVLH
jgi:hypothetical protein